MLYYAMKKEALVQNYLQLLGIPCVQTLEDITRLIQAHEETFAFSSLKVLLKEDVSLKFEDIYNDLVLNKRGGYCFEHNKLIHDVLKTLGFDVSFYLARVINNLPEEEPTTHRFTLLQFEGKKYLLDSGIGFRTPNIPIQFGNIITVNPHGIKHTIKEYEDNTLGLVVLHENSEFRVTMFDLNPCLEADFILGHFYSHKHPCAVFVNNLVLSRITKQIIYSLRNQDYFRIYPTHQEKIIINSFEHFETIIKEDFNCCYSSQEARELYEKFVL